MGQSKPDAIVAGQSLLKRVLAVLQPNCQQLLVVVRDPLQVAGGSLPEGARTIVDIIPGRGPLGGLHAGLSAATSRFALTVACDMPFLDGALLDHQVRLAPGFDAVVPQVNGRLQPLHAVYSKNCLPTIERLLQGGSGSLHELLLLLHVRCVEEAEVLSVAKSLRSFFNVNTLDDLERAAEMAQLAAPG